MFEVATACALLLVLLAAALVGWSRAEARAEAAEEQVSRWVMWWSSQQRESLHAVSDWRMPPDPTWDVESDVRLLRAALAEDENADE